MENKELREKIPPELSNPWPTKDVLNKLIWATEYLLHEKNYDGHGHEELQICVKRGKEILELLNHPFIKKIEEMPVVKTECAIVSIYKTGRIYKVRVVIGVQSFNLDYEEPDKKQCEWYAEQVRTALSKLSHSPSSQEVTDEEISAKLDSMNFKTSEAREDAYDLCEWKRSKQANKKP